MGGFTDFYCPDCKQRPEYGKSTLNGETRMCLCGLQFCQVTCPHCDKVNYWGDRTVEDGINDGVLRKCWNCQGAIQRYYCWQPGGCNGFTQWKDGGFVEGTSKCYHCGLICKPWKNKLSPNEQAAKLALESYCRMSERFVKVRKRTLETLRKLRTDCKKLHENVGTAKGASAGFAVGAAITMFFAPPVAIAGGIASGVTSLATGVSNYTLSSDQAAVFKRALEEDEESRKLWEKRRVNCAVCLSSMKCSVRDDYAKAIMTLGIAAYSTYSAANTVLTLHGMLSLVTEIQGMAGVGEATIRYGTGLSAMMFQMTGLGESGLRQVTVSMGGGAASGEAATVSVVASTGAKAMAGVAAVWSVYDLYKHQTTPNDFLKEINTAISQLESSLSDLEKVANPG